MTKPPILCPKLRKYQGITKWPNQIIHSTVSDIQVQWGIHIARLTSTCIGLHGLRKIILSTQQAYLPKTAHCS